MKYPIWWFNGEKITSIWVFQEQYSLAILQTVRIHHSSQGFQRINLPDLVRMTVIGTGRD